MMSRGTIHRGLGARALWVTAFIIGVSMLFAAPAAAAPLQTLVAFDPAAHETPENLAIDRDGTVYVSHAFASEVLRLSPDGRQTRLAVPTAGGITVGIAIDQCNAGLYVAVRSPDAAAAGIWRVSLGSFDDPVRIAALPTDSFPNGIAFDPQGNLYIADSSLGRIWRLAAGASQATVWSSGPLLAPTGASFMGFPLPGANGIKLRHHAVYVSNTATQTILATPVDRDGSAGETRVVLDGIEADDFAFADNGDLYVAENPPSLLARVMPGGRVSILATGADGLDNPSAVAFGRLPGQRHLLYVTNAAYFGSHPSLEVLRLRVGTDGARVDAPVVRANGRCRLGEHAARRARDDGRRSSGTRRWSVSSHR
jgi:sugar lactone lactonase YvrE